MNSDGIGKSPEGRRYALIAGSESGLAKAAIATFPDCYHVFCADIRYSQVREVGNRTEIPVDITDQASLERAYSIIASRTCRLDVVSCFAGIVTLGSFVELPPSAMERIMDINFFAQVRINKIFFPLLENAGGRIITISSEYGRLDALPIHGYYGISKHALEAYNDSLRRELLKSGVKVVMIRPGAFRTNMQAGIARQFEDLLASTRRYKRILTRMNFLMAGELARARDPAIFGRVFAKAAFSRHPGRYHNVKNSLRMRLLSSLPSAIQDMVFRFFL